MMDEKVAAFVAEGKSEREAKKLAEDWVATPGTSEHELGIAVDINSEGSGSEADGLYQWLSENAYRYGFIQRYPQDKSDITGISYEPWNYRYVGREAAEEIYSEGICLEEYLE